MKKIVLLLSLLLCVVLRMSAQEFVNLTAPDVRIDKALPIYYHEFPLGTAYADSVYTVSIEYPEFIDMSEDDVRRYHELTSDSLPSLPVVEQYIGVSRRRGTLYISLVPLVFRDGKYQKLVSFRLRLESQARVGHSLSRATRSTDSVSCYASHSVLSSGQWAKISIPETGVYQLTEALVRQAGFSDITKVKIYGYGGALQPEVLTAEYLAETDDLSEVPTCMVGGRRLFHGVGPVGWESATSTIRTRNPYATAGYYFLTETSDEPLLVDSTAFVSAFYPTTNDYHSLSENDEFAWYHSGRNLFEKTPVPSSSSASYVLPAHTDSGTLTIVMSYDGLGMVGVEVNDSVVGNVNITSVFGETSKAAGKTVYFPLTNLRSQNTVRLRQTSGEGNLRLDYLSLTMPSPAPAPNLSTDAFAVPQFVYRITNQDHHADAAADMIIIIPTSQKLLQQAERLKQLHEQLDSLRVRIVPADELFNEYSSGTPDANAYRRYLKMLYDRASSETDMPRYLLLFGDGAWDNRMLTSDWRTFSPDDFLLCYESEDSYSTTNSYVSDDYFCLLDDGEGGDLTKKDKTDVGVGRLTARTEEEAKILVDKIYGYVENANAGDWQNTLCFMGDDGNGNIHMTEADAAAAVASEANPSFNIKKIYWDAYERVTTSTGNRYPDASRLIKQQMQQGALIMDYCGHGVTYCLSHEQVVRIEDFAEQTSLRLPLWVTASCDIMPYDSQEENIGETAMFNTRGGAIAFFGTTRTVYTGDNKNMNCAFIKHALATDATGRPNRLGDAVRLSKNEVRAMPTDPSVTPHESYVINKLHYSLLGDPALRLAIPTEHIVIDSINGQLVSTADTVKLAAGQKVTVAGHVEGAAFNGVVSLTVKDIEQTIVCRLNDDTGSSTPFRFADRPITIYNGQDSVRQGRFQLSFVLPKDISYSDQTGRMMAYAVSNDRLRMGNGHTESFVMGSGSDASNDGIGPSIYCYLNSSDFQNGDEVNTTPYFYAQLTDKDGINAAGSSLGHDLELVVDGQLSMTYNLNEYFRYDFGDYRSGSVGYTLPTLAEGEHKLTFRAWDVLNNSSVAELRFRVVRGLEPNCFSVECTHNPATTYTTFVINHDRTGSQMDVELEVFDASGRLLWRKSETGLSTDNTYTLDWDLTTSSGSRLRTGVYLYRVLISTDGSSKASKAQKIIIL
ncbi:MAG: type IX secretion system sortase PorU [Prevotella sp.]|nr:type IX secretion system sortase PorU [Prevotella sp.]